MSNDNKIAETIKAVEGVVQAVPVYQDAIQPAAKELGHSLLTVARCVNLALAPVSGLVWGYDRIKDFVTKRVSEKLSGISNDEIVNPKPEVAGPALEALRYSGHDENLRELYANLLATSMDASTTTNAHPAFVEIIKNLSPDEARLMRIFATRTDFPLVDIVIDVERPGGPFLKFATNVSLVGCEAGCAHAHLTQAYVINLCRMGLLEVIPDIQMSPVTVYDDLENSHFLSEFIEQLKSQGAKYRFVRKVLHKTNWGQQFCQACIVEKQGAASKTGTAK